MTNLLVIERGAKPDGMFFQRGRGVCEKVEVFSGKFEALSEDAADTLVNKGSAIHLSVPAIQESIFVGKVDAEEAMLMFGILTQHAI